MACTLDLRLLGFHQAVKWCLCCCIKLDATAFARSNVIDILLLGIALPSEKGYGAIFCETIPNYLDRIKLIKILIVKKCILWDWNKLFDVAIFCTKAICWKGKWYQHQVLRKLSSTTVPRTLELEFGPPFFEMCSKQHISKGCFPLSNTAHAENSCWIWSQIFARFRNCHWELPLSIFSSHLPFLCAKREKSANIFWRIIKLCLRLRSF